MIIQLAIAITGIFAIWFSQDNNLDRRKYACWFGLAGQPFWFYVSYQEQLWGIFALTFFYTLAWLKGFKCYWLKKREVH